MVSKYFFAELMLATAPVNADCNGKRFEGREHSQDGMHHECLKCLQLNAYKRDVHEYRCERCCTSLEQACGSCLRLLPSISRCNKWGS